MSTITLEGIIKVRSKIKDTMRKVGRVESVHIVAVTKAFPSSAMDSAVDAGIKHIGELRVRETMDKIANFKQREKVQLHLIGHLQRNKAKKAVEIYDFIESIDGIDLLFRINQLAGEIGKKQKVLLQVNSAADPAKSGFSEKELISNMKLFPQLPHLAIMGVMMIGKRDASPEETQMTFAKTRQLRDTLLESLPEATMLSMGMSGDFPLAIAEGATHIRLGSALFGEREPYNRAESIQREEELAGK